MAFQFNAAANRILRIVRKLSAVVLLFLCADASFAQTGTGEYARQFLTDERKLWTSPLHVHTFDLKWLAPLGVGTAFLLRNDRAISQEAGDANLEHPSRIVSRAGSVYSIATPVTVMMLGRISGNAKASHAGGVALEAALHSVVIVQTLKAATNRERPWIDHGRGDFWDGGNSFPSGHSIIAWAVASTFADQYAGKKWIAISGYSAAAAVSLSRVGGLNHFPSDVLVGSSLGWLVGHYISQRHK
jgi:membrane-associated phospholipid phosphatase